MKNAKPSFGCAKYFVYLVSGTIWIVKYFRSFTGPINVDLYEFIKKDNCLMTKLIKQISRYCLFLNVVNLFFRIPIEYLCFC